MIHRWLSSPGSSTAVGSTGLLVLASNALLLVWGLLDQWRITHLMAPFLLESLILAAFAMYHIMRGTLRGYSYTVDGGPPTRARGPRLVMGLRALSVCFIGLFVLLLLAILLAIFQPIPLPRAVEFLEPLRLLGVLALVVLLVQRHHALYRRRRLRDGALMDLNQVVRSYRNVLSAWLGLGLLVVFAAMITASVAGLIADVAGEGWRRPVDALLLMAAIAGKTWYEWWMEASDRNATRET